MFGCGSVGRIVSTTVCVLGVWISEAQAAERLVKAQHATVELIASGEAPDATGGLWLGIRFSLEPGWHIYWRNPGDSGQPPVVQWQLPSGVSAGAFEWPAPERIPVDTLVNYGYKDSVVLPVRLTIAKEMPAGGLSIGATLRWLICHDVCIPDRAGLQLRLPLADPDRKQLPGWRKGIEEARSRVPRPMPAAWQAAAESRKDSFVVSLSMDRPAPAAAVLFPVDPGQINDSAPQEVKASGRVLTLSLLKSDQLSDDPEVLRFVLAASAGEAFGIEVRVRPQTGAYSKERNRR